MPAEFSGIRLTLGINPEQFKELEETLKSVPNGGARAFSAAVNRTLSTGRTYTSRRIREHLNLPAATIKDAMKIVKSTPSTMSGHLQFRRKPIPLIEFKPSQTPSGVSIRVRKDKGRETIKSAFIATMSNGHQGVFKRAPGSTHRRRPDGQWTQLPIKELFGPTIVGAFTGAPGIATETLNELSAVLKKNIESQTNRLLNRKKADLAEE